MKKHTHTILAGVVVATITFVVTYSLLPRHANAPASTTQSPSTSSSSNAPAGAVTMPVSIVSIRDNADSMASDSPTISIEYPQFPSLPADFDTAIASSVTSRLDQFKKDIADNEAARTATAKNMPGQPSATIPQSAYSFLVSWQASQMNSDYVSLIIRYDEYSGGANEDQEIQTFNFDVKKGTIIGLSDLFGTYPDYLDTISRLAQGQLIDSLTTASAGNPPTDMITAGTAPTADNFADFTFTDNLVTFYFPKYAVAPGSFGEQQVTIPRSEIK